MPADMLPVLWRSAVVTFRATWRAARQLFHEAMGAFFVVFALYGAMAAWRQWKYKPTWWLVAFAIVYALMMGAFAFLSFRRARRIR
jgi:glycerol uptake facilitator-like aquaporin